MVDDYSSGCIESVASVFSPEWMVASSFLVNFVNECKEFRGRGRFGQDLAQVLAGSRFQFGKLRQHVNHIGRITALDRAWYPGRRY